MAKRILIRRDTALNWSTNNPVLYPGEIGIETDTLKMKVGPVPVHPAVATAWNSISSYVNTVPSDLNTTLNGYLEATDLNDTVAALDANQNLLIPNDSIIFEGATDNGYETTLQATDPTADRTITLPNATGTIALTTDIPAKLTVTQVDLSGTATETYTDILTLAFDADSGFDVTNPSAGVAKVAMNSTFKYWEVDGVQKLTATGLDTVNFISGNNISITADGTADPQEITIAATGVITTSDAGTVTNTMLAGSIANDKLTNSAITINGTSTSLGGTRTLYTDDITEDGSPTNLWFTDERAQDAIGNVVGNGLDYDDSTGAISVDPSEFALNSVGTPTADISMATYKITNLGSPTSANDAATKAYVDNTTAGLNFHAAVHVATTANLDATYNNGTSGVGATLTANANGALVVDGHTLSVDERVLVKNQTTGFQNGLYVVTATGDGSNPYILTRATDADNSPAGEIAYGDFTFVQSGTTNGGYGYIVNTTGTITIGTTAISYVQFNAGQTVIAGNGLTESSPGTLAINTAVTADLSTAQTLTNKSISGSSNTLSNIPNSALTNSSITINGSAVSLGGSTTISVPGAATPTSEGLLFGSSSSSVNTSTSVGYQAGNVAGATTTNTFFGYQAGPINTTGFANSIIGYRAGYLNVSGQRNTFMGAYSGYSNTSNYNTYIGQKAGHQTTTASGNVAIGYEAMGIEATGTTKDNGGSNVAIGQSALGRLTGANAYQNIGIGNLAGVEATTGQRSVYIGNWAGGIGTALTGSNNILIGHNSAPSSASVSNEITLGDANITTFRIPGLSLTATTSNPIVQLTSTQTLTNKTISGSSNTITNVSLSTGVTGTLPIANGGTGQTTANAAFNALAPSQSTNSGKYLTTDGTNTSWASLVVPITTGTATITADTATTIDTNALAGFTSIEYMISLKQGSKVRTSKVVLQTDGTSVDMTEFAITETGGTMSGVVVSATTSGSDAILQVTVTDASSTNVTVKFSEVKL